MPKKRAREIYYNPLEKKAMTANCGKQPIRSKELPIQIHQRSHDTQWSDGYFEQEESRNLPQHYTKVSLHKFTKEERDVNRNLKKMLVLKDPMISHQRFLRS